MNEEPTPQSQALTGEMASIRRLLMTGAIVMVLIVGGVLTGAKLWPRVVNVERRVVSPIREVGRGTGADDTLPDLVDAACPAIVKVVLPAAPAPTPTPSARHSRHATHSGPVPGQTPLDARLLEAFAISNDGFLVTSGRQLGGLDKVQLLTSDGDTLDAEVRAVDPISGLALLKTASTDLTALQFAEGDFPRIGTWGFTLSAPNGTGCTVERAVVASDFAIAGAAGNLHASITTGPARTTNAEGLPLLGSDGRVLGVSAYASAKDAADPGVLVPGEIAAQLVSEMLRTGKPPNAPYGILADDLSATLAQRLGADRQRGAVVVMLGAGSPAADAGLHVGDVILSAGNAPISGPSELARALGDGSKALVLDVARGGQHQQITIEP